MKYDLSLPDDRRKYFQEKVGIELDALNEYLESSSFVVYLLAKKMAGKGTYATMLREIFGEDKIAHLSVGDIMRYAEHAAETEKGTKELKKWFEEEYAGGFKADDLVEMLKNHEFAKYYPTGMIISLLKKAIRDSHGKALMIDGFPRNVSQIENALQFTDLIDYREDPDFFVHIEIPKAVIEARYAGRRVCPKCGNSRNLPLLLTPEIRYDSDTGEFILLCDNPSCDHQELVRKQADDAGMQAVEKRNQDTQELMDEVRKYTDDKYNLTLQNGLKVGEEIEDYEVTQVFDLEVDEDTGKITKIPTPLVVKDDDGDDSYSLMAATVVKDFLKQLATGLELI